MRGSPESRAITLGEYIAREGATVRQAAGVFSVSKSTVHKDVSQRLKNINLSLYTEVSKVLAYNKSQRHLRGGEATKNKYKAKRES